MKNTKNCRIGWIVPNFVGRSYRFSVQGDMLIIESQKSDGSGYRQDIYKVSGARNTVSNMYKRFPHHPLLRTLMTTPPINQVLAWGDPNIYNTTKN